ncbi:MAG: hypothetical protein ACOCZ5_03480 [bacterium]
MKLQEVFEPILRNVTSSTDMLLHNNISGKSLELFKDILLKCDEFKNVDELVILEAPHVSNTNKEIVKSITYKIANNTKFEGKVYLYGISLTPELYDYEHLLQPIKNDCNISHRQYNPNDFTHVYRNIMIRFNPEDYNRNELHEKLDDILNNPEDYKIKGIQNIIVRGIFEKMVKPNGEIDNREVGELNLDYENQPFFIASYFDEKFNENNESVSIMMENKFIPIELKDKYLMEFDTNNIPTKEQIDEFLNKNKI